MQSQRTARQPLLAMVAWLIAGMMVIAMTLAFVWSLQAESTTQDVGGARPPDAWSRLSASQQVALQPLKSLWPAMGEARRQKWVLIASRLHGLSKQAQVRLQSRMAYWAELTPQERAAARIKYLRLKGRGSAMAGAVLVPVSPGLVHMAPGATTILTEVPPAQTD